MHIPLPINISVLSILVYWKPLCGKTTNRRVYYSFFLFIYFFLFVLFCVYMEGNMEKMIKHLCCLKVLCILFWNKFQIWGLTMGFLWNNTFIFSTVWINVSLGQKFCFRAAEKYYYWLRKAELQLARISCRVGEVAVYMQYVELSYQVDRSNRWDLRI